MQWPFRRRRRALPVTKSEPRFRNPYFAGPSPEKTNQRMALELTALGLVFCGLVIVAIFSPAIFGLTTIDVQGNERLSKETIQRTAQESLANSHLGFLPRSNVLTVSMPAITAGLKSHFALDTVTVKRRWPHTLVITVKESYPAFALKLDAQSAALMTRQGSVAEILTDLSKLKDYPVLVLPEALTAATGETILMPALSSRIPDLSGKLRAAGLNVTELRLQLPDCPKQAAPQEQGTNTNSSDNTNIDVNLNTNATPVPEPTPCTVQDRVKRAEDVRAQLETGYGLLISTSEDLGNQLQKYQTFKTNEADAVVHDYVDLRVPGRIYFK